MVPQIISFNCILKNSVGQLISSTYNKDVLTSVNDSQAMLLGLSKGLQDLKAGEKRKIFLRAEEAYGFYDPKKIVYYPRKRLSKDVRPGEVITIIGKSGKAKIYKVLGLHTDMVSLDANHPLAGQDLVFEIETLAARKATTEEIESACNDVSVQLLH
jgi:FKBP-type peptidyl-prolyl cis-trans isomerase SlyD